MAAYCPCSGAFANEITPEAFDWSMKGLENIARYHKFEWLLETVVWIRRTNE